MKNLKWSVRHVPLESKNKLLEVQKISGGWLVGELLGFAIDFWYQNLPEEPEDDASKSPTEAIDFLQPQVGHNIAHLKNGAASHSLGNEEK